MRVAGRRRTLALVKREMGECGLVGVGCGVSCLLYCEEDVYRYYDEPEYYYEMRDRMLSEVESALQAADVS